VLSAMRRRYTTDDYRRLIDDALDRIPFLGLGTDLMVGFPGETARDFSETVALVRELPFSNLHVFPYSPRPGTDAASRPRHLPRAESHARARALIELGTTKRQEFAERFLGRPVSVLVERVSPDGEASGLTSEYLEACLRGNSLRPNDLTVALPSLAQGGRLFAAPTSARDRRTARCDSRREPVRGTTPQAAS
jgi:threonylcarbamoyladenosine tRNA methylthiotransferase MtaB